jgi:hypothetical protein
MSIKLTRAVGYFRRRFAIWALSVSDKLADHAFELAAKRTEQLKRRPPQ